MFVVEVATLEGKKTKFLHKWKRTKTSSDQKRRFKTNGKQEVKIGWRLRRSRRNSGLSNVVCLWMGGVLYMLMLYWKEWMSRTDSMENSYSVSVCGEKAHKCVSVFIQQRVACSVLRSVGALHPPAGRWIRGLAEPWESQDIHRLLGWEPGAHARMCNNPHHHHHLFTSDAKGDEGLSRVGVVCVIPATKTGRVRQVNLRTVWDFYFLQAPLLQLLIH